MCTHTCSPSPSQVGTIGSTIIDMIVTNTTAYDGFRPDGNGKDGNSSFGTININAPDSPEMDVVSVNLSFSFVTHT